MLAIIGGTGLSRIDCFEPDGEEIVDTPYSKHGVTVGIFQIESARLAMLPRHGKDQVIPPHKINYRANIWALMHLGVSQIVSINAVGGIHKNLAPGSFAVPDQLIDYTTGRESTFYEENLKEVIHTDFTSPYSEELRQLILSSANAIKKDEHAQRFVMNTCLARSRTPGYCRGRRSSRHREPPAGRWSARCRADRPAPRLRSSAKDR